MDLVAVHLVQHLVASAGIVERVDREAGIAQALLERAHVDGAARHGVGVSGQQQDRKPDRNRRDRRGLHRARGHRHQIGNEAVRHRKRVAAEWIGEVGVDLGGIAREPVERRARWLEGGVERREPRERLVAEARLDGLADGLRRVEQSAVGAGRARECEARERCAVALRIGLCEQCAHRVPE